MDAKRSIPTWAIAHSCDYVPATGWQISMAIFRGATLVPLYLTCHKATLDRTLWQLEASAQKLFLEPNEKKTYWLLAYSETYETEVVRNYTCGVIYTYQETVTLSDCYLDNSLRYYYDHSLSHTVVRTIRCQAGHIQPMHNILLYSV